MITDKDTLYITTYLSLSHRLGLSQALTVGKQLNTMEDSCENVHLESLYGFLHGRTYVYTIIILSYLTMNV